MARAVRTAAIPLVLAMAANAAYAQDDGRGTKDPDESESVTDILERYLDESQADDADAVNAPLWFNGSLLGSQAALAAGGPGGDMGAMNVIMPPPLSGGTLPGLGQYLNDWLLGNDYQACSLLTTDCLTISRANFDYSYLSLILNLVQAPNVLDLDGNQPASHLTLIGAVHSDSYIQLGDSNYFGNNNDADCIIIGLACTWQTHAAQDNQVIIGDGGYANGSNSVVIGTNARHALPTVDAAELGWTGGPDANYADRLGNAVVIGDGANGSADRQTVLGANASSTHANSVALGADSVTVRGAQGGYLAPGFGAVLQSSAGEVSIGSTGAERQLTNVAAGSAATDAVNVAQLQGAINEMSGDGAFAVRYDDDGTGTPDFARATLAGPGGTTLGNLAAGVADDEAVNVGQLRPVVGALGGGAAIDPGTGAVTGPIYVLDDGTDTGTTTAYNDVGTALENLDGRVSTNTTTINNILGGTEGLVRQDPGTLQVTVAGQTGGSQVSFANVDGDARRLSGVDDGLDDADAANMGQLRAVEDQVVDLDALAVKYDDASRGTITLGNLGGTVIGNLAAGEVSATSTEAVNGAQLFGVGQSVADHLGGGATVNVDGSISAPTYVIQGDNYHSVGDAFDAVDGALGDVGDQIDTVDAFAVKYDDDGSGNPDYGRATLAGPGGTVLGNIAAGVADDEAVNVGQLAPVVDALGGGAVIDPGTGTVTGPTYVLDDGTDTGTTTAYNDVGTALENLDGRVSTNTTHINNLLDGTGGLVRQDPGTLLVTVAGQTGGSEVSFANVNGDARRLSGVGDGVDDTDAANMGQLRSVEDLIGDIDALAVKYDDATLGTITLGGAGGTVLDNLAAGAVSATSLQAVNGSQMYAYLDRVAAFFGGGASVDAAGALLTPSYAIQGGFYSNVGDALAALDNAIDGISITPPPAGGEPDPLVQVDGERNGSDDAQVVDDSHGVAIGSSAVSGGENAVAVGGDSLAAGANDTAIGGNARVHADGSTAIGANAVIASGATHAVAVGEGASVAAASGTAIGQGSSVTADNAVALGRGSVADQANTVSVGSAGNERRITNVAAGTADTDAANVGQLNAGVQHAIEISNEYTDMRFSQIQSDIWEIDRGYRAGVASALAVAGLPQAYLPGKSMVAAAVGGYKQEGALAIGITTVSENGRWIYKFSGTTNTVRDVGVTMGAGFQW